ncbi:hypothetical protein FDP41_009362 [Naegleria fowleri]|uniref:RWP-RK domain-containing protein n=1 Tax=Naegleria fowleri TaxID=5763 RepID=A0A6A5BHG8_NAEFO|nr:uncharacterized protein FDP41_009362 [Naegleria fowleri]KAF0972459.1 hypothetical protein FDP41_009362 [Naegleria fowleri]CAG4714565.1 unnamed protein product [Naegleria fowleri]
MVNFTNFVKSKRKRKKEITFQDIQENFDLPIKEAADAMQISLTQLKRICRENDIPRWPYRKLQALQNKRQDLTDMLPNSDELSRERIQSKIDAINEEIKFIRAHPKTIIGGSGSKRSSITKSKRWSLPSIVSGDAMSSGGATSSNSNLILEQTVLGGGNSNSNRRSQNEEEFFKDLQQRLNKQYGGMPANLMGHELDEDDVVDEDEIIGDDALDDEEDENTDNLMRSRNQQQKKDANRNKRFSMPSMMLQGGSSSSCTNNVIGQHSSGGVSTFIPKQSTSVNNGIAVNNYTTNATNYTYSAPSQHVVHPPPPISSNASAYYRMPPSNASPSSSSQFNNAQHSQQYYPPQPLTTTHVDPYTQHPYSHHHHHHASGYNYGHSQQSPSHMSTTSSSSHQLPTFSQTHSSHPYNSSYNNSASGQTYSGLGSTAHSVAQSSPSHHHQQQYHTFSGNHSQNSSFNMTTPNTIVTTSSAPSDNGTATSSNLHSQIHHHPLNATPSTMHTTTSNAIPTSSSGISGGFNDKSTTTTAFQSSYSHVHNQQSSGSSGRSTNNRPSSLNINTSSSSSDPFGFNRYVRDGDYLPPLSQLLHGQDAERMQDSPVTLNEPSPFGNNANKPNILPPVHIPFEQQQQQEPSQDCDPQRSDASKISQALNILKKKNTGSAISSYPSLAQSNSTGHLEQTCSTSNNRNGGGGGGGGGGGIQYSSTSIGGGTAATSTRENLTYLRKGVQSTEYEYPPFQYYSQQYESSMPSFIQIPSHRASPNTQPQQQSSNHAPPPTLSKSRSASALVQSSATTTSSTPPSQASESQGSSNSKLSFLENLFRRKIPFITRKKK